MQLDKETNKFKIKQEFKLTTTKRKLTNKPEPSRLKFSNKISNKTHKIIHN